MQLAPGHYVFVQTKSKLFKNSASGHPEFIMSTHSIVRCALLCTDSFEDCIPIMLAKAGSVFSSFGLSVCVCLSVCLSVSPRKSVKLLMK